MQTRTRTYDENYGHENVAWRVTPLKFGLRCSALRGGGYAGAGGLARREPGAVVALRVSGGRFAEAYTEARVQFRDGTGHWLPLYVISYQPHLYQ